MCVGIKDLSSVMLTALVHFLSSLHAVSLLPLHYCQGSQQLVETGHPGKPCLISTFWPLSLCWNGGNYNPSALRHCPTWLLHAVSACLTSQKPTLGPTLPGK